MRFRQIDRITELIPGKTIVAEKTLTGREDYLRDHFPRFPVQPGVMMLESLFQAAQFLVRTTEQYYSGIVMLRGTRNIKFASFLEPGETLIVEAEIMKCEGNSYTVKASGRKADGPLCVAGKLIIDTIQPEQPNSVDQHAAAYIRQIVEQLQQAAMA